MTELVVVERPVAKAIPSDKSFGLVFAALFFVFGLFPLMHQAPTRLWAMPVAAALLLVSFIRPKVLHPFNFVWFRFGLLLHVLISPLIMGFIFFVVITPIGLLMRALVTDLLSLKIDHDKPTYWVTRPEAETGDMRRQF